ARALDHGSRLLPVDAVDLHPAVQSWTGLQEARGRELVSEGQDRARQRAGHRWALRALRHPGRATIPGPVVLSDNELCRTAPREPRQPRLVLLHRPPAEELDRPQ